MSKTITLALTDQNKFIFVMKSINPNDPPQYLSSISQQIFILREQLHQSISKLPFYTKQYDEYWKRSMDLWELEKKLNDKYQVKLINIPPYYY